MDHGKESKQWGQRGALFRRTHVCVSGKSVFLLRLLTLGMADSTCTSWHGLGGSWDFSRGLSDFQL